MPKVSVIVPVYNVETEIEACLDSLVNQTLKEIEIICVDDFSRDGSKEILQKYADKDERITLVFHKENAGTSQARKDGVSVSHGKYIMFVDGDDYLEPAACEIAYKAIEEKKTDILNFGVHIVNRGNFSAERIASNQRLVSPLLETLEDADLIRCCWDEHKFSFSLWNKIYNGDICRRAFSFIEDGYFPKAQDLYAFFVIVYFSKSFSGISDQLYHYNFGIGVTGGQYLTLEKFDALLCEYNVYEAIVRFLNSQNVFEEYADIAKKIYRHFLNECVSKWRDLLRAEDFSQGFNRLVQTWGLQDVVCNLAETHWYHPSGIAEKMMDLDYFRHVKRSSAKTKTIAAYYHSIYNGGTQRVVAALCNMWAAMKDESGNPLYNVVLVTDEAPVQGEYPLDERVKRALLPEQDGCVQERYKRRFAAWERILEMYDIDIVVNSMWNSPCTLWDMLCIKGFKTKPAYLIHCHTFTCLPFQYATDSALMFTHLYQMCDGVVVLSECDERFVSAFSGYAKCIANPMTFSGDSTADVLQNREKGALIWVGRISPEKQPFDAVAMMSYIVKDFPKAKLYMVGAGEPDLSEQLRNYIEACGLQKHVVLTGLVKDVRQYYRKANICVSTSELEGAPLVFCEAMWHELPIVSYDMPWLTFMQDGRGIVAVKQKRADLLAKEVVRLLNAPDKSVRLGKEGKRQIDDLQKIDIAEAWRDYFDGVGAGERLRTLPTSEETLYRYICLYQQIGKTAVRNSMQRLLNDITEQRNEKSRLLQKTYDEKYERGLKIKELEKQVKALKQQKETLENQIHKIRHSKSYKIGKWIMYLPVKLKKYLLRK